ncbi:MAG: Thiazolinyl imide reductase in siderophore biosynthesis gene cluster [uncultured Pseudonocardia sp.]|uniref:Thiazolinyl imide reductase in siderophore biosynthesis gene cluster n=1 Tax=uncultured Pseudonocardia sp. TaxID=211455 RepID=A0A6J4QAK0_9PSEU|nr:MAG: Thiazolinyl imide reductase in siderophore biosynthesis gene cluster [uncultured Pseudonocardia sp.]
MTAPPAVVCGTRFGRVYLEALSAPDAPYRLVGILARGSERSRACAEHYGVPLHTDVDDVPDVAAAFVVVGSGLAGGPGAELARGFLDRGVPVLQEHPLHPDELADCIRAARRNRTVHHVDTLFLHVEPVRRFIGAARALLDRQDAVFVEVTCGHQVLQTALDVVVAVLGGIGWSSFVAHPPEPGPFRTVAGELAGVPLALRVQHELDPAEPDNHAHVLHRITIGTEGGQLTLVATHGPVVWTPRAHMPADVAQQVPMHASGAAHLDLPSGEVLGPPSAPSYRDVLARLWPDAIRRAATALRVDVEDAGRGGDGGRAHAQHQLALSRLTREVNELLGPVPLVRRPTPRVLGPADFLPVATEVRG